MITAGFEPGNTNLVLRADPEVGDLDLALPGQENVSGFEISVDDSVLVEEVEALDHLPTDVRDLLLRQALGQVDDDGVERAAVAELDEHLEKKANIHSLGVQ